MKKALFALAMLLMGFTVAQAQIYKGKSTKVSFYSHTALEDISAVDTTGVFLLNTKSNTVIAQVVIKGFKFPNALMEEHFNENYMESDKYPKATFNGKINEKIDYTKDGTYNVTMTGDLDMHGVKKPRTINATLVVKNGVITVDGKFDVLLKDHNIKVPEAVGAKIAESIEVTIHSVMTPPAAAPANKK
ncbi:MAG: hypothetical protein Fur0041_02180 [Bacteroidia bacterium]